MIGPYDLSFLDKYKLDLQYDPGTDIYRIGWAEHDKLWPPSKARNYRYLRISAVNLGRMNPSEFIHYLRDHGVPLEGQERNEEQPLFEHIARLYYAYMATGARSPIPHLVGPPGTGKSTVIKTLADMLGVTLHTFNVARISPLELEGVQMPSTSTDGEEHDMMLKLLHNPMWTRLKDGDIVLLDEFLRGFPEVYNGLLDTLTSREVAGLVLPNVFFIAASNSTATYDEALRDRLLHIMVPDVRRSATALVESKQRFVEDTGLNPAMAASQEMSDLFVNNVFPMYEMLDSFTSKASGSAPLAGTAKTGFSVRNLTGQVLLREVQSTHLKELIEYNNRKSIVEGKHQFVILMDGRRPSPVYVDAAKKLVGNEKLTPVQANNLRLNLQLIELQEAISAKEPAPADSNNTEELADDFDF